MTKTSPKPFPSPLAMSAAPKDIAPRPRKSKYPSPRLRFECRDLDHPGASTFFENSQPAQCLATAVHSVLSTLYTPSKTNEQIPPTRSVTLILREMDGVAYTIGTDLDSDHKEIHFSLDYIQDIAKKTPERVDAEVQGILVHEMVQSVLF